MSPTKFLPEDTPACTSYPIWMTPPKPPNLPVLTPGSLAHHPLSSRESRQIESTRSGKGRRTETASHSTGRPRRRRSAAHTKGRPRERTRTRGRHPARTGEAAGEVGRCPAPSALASPGRRGAGDSGRRCRLALLPEKCNFDSGEKLFPGAPAFFSPSPRGTGGRGQERGRLGAPDSARPPPDPHSPAGLTPKPHSWSSHSWARRTRRRSLRLP